MKYELDINTKYTRETAPSSYPKIGGEYNQEQDKCNNFKLRNNEGREENPENKITHIVVGYTVGEYKASLGNFLTGNVGTHFLIKKDGPVDQLVKTEYAPYALGPGALAGKLNPEHFVKDNLLNNFAITIHNVNDAKTPFTDKQIEANAYLMEKLVDEHQINSKFVIAHADYAPVRYTISPGPYFPWKDLAKATEHYDVKYNFGIYSFKAREQNPEIILSKDKHSKTDIETVQNKLEEYGIKVLKEDKSNLGEWDLATQRGILAFNFHHKGEEIIQDPEKLKVYEDCIDVAHNPEAYKEAFLKMSDTLTVWDSNNDIIVRDLIEQLNVTLVGEQS